MATSCSFGYRLAALLTCAKQNGDNNEVQHVECAREGSRGKHNVEESSKKNLFGHEGSRLRLSDAMFGCTIRRKAVRFNRGVQLRIPCVQEVGASCSDILLCVIMRQL